jgi:hypothetical protein
MSTKRKKPIVLAMRDKIAERLEDGKPLDQYSRDLMAHQIRTYWSNDPAAAKLNHRFSESIQAGSADWERKKLIAGGMPAAEADEKLYRKYGKPSAQAFKRWIYRNRRVYRRL